MNYGPLEWPSYLNHLLKGLPFRVSCGESAGFGGATQSLTEAVRSVVNAGLFLRVSLFWLLLENVLSILHLGQQAGVLPSL